MESKKFKVIIVEDVKLELKGTEEIFRHEIPNAEVIGTAMTENEFWELLGSIHYSYECVFLCGFFVGISLCYLSVVPFCLAGFIRE